MQWRSGQDKSDKWPTGEIPGPWQRTEVMTPGWEKRVIGTSKWVRGPELEQNVLHPSKCSRFKCHQSAGNYRKPPAAKKKRSSHSNNLINFAPELTQTGVTGKGRAYRQVLEQPGSQGVGGHFGENPSLFVV